MTQVIRIENDVDVSYYDNQEKAKAAMEKEFMAAKERRVVSMKTGDSAVVIFPQSEEQRRPTIMWKCVDVPLTAFTTEELKAELDRRCQETAEEENKKEKYRFHAGDYVILKLEEDARNPGILDHEVWARVIAVDRENDTVHLRRYLRQGLLPINEQRRLPLRDAEEKGYYQKMTDAEVEIFTENITKKCRAHTAEGCTELDYMYRDGAGYKIHWAEVLPGVLSDEEISALLKACEAPFDRDLHWFHPEVCGLPARTFVDEGYQPQPDDVPWFEIDDIYKVEKEPTVDITAREFLSMILSGAAVAEL